MRVMQHDPLSSITMRRKLQIGKLKPLSRCRDRISFAVSKKTFTTPTIVTHCKRTLQPYSRGEAIMPGQFPTSMGSIAAVATLLACVGIPTALARAADCLTAPYFPPRGQMVLSNGSATSEVLVLAREEPVDQQPAAQAGSEARRPRTLHSNSLDCIGRCSEQCRSTDQRAASWTGTRRGRRSVNNDCPRG
jgi:hypothetical protein